MAEHKPSILWSPEALDDIDHLWDYYVHAAGRVTADKILRELRRPSQSSMTFPLPAKRATKSGLVCARWQLLPKLSSID